MPTPATRIRDTSPRLLMILTGIAVIFALKYSQEVLIPLTLAILFSFLLAPIITWLERCGLNRVASVVTTVIFSFAVMGAISWLVVAQVLDLGNKLPDYENNVRHKIESFQAASSGAFGRMGQTFDELSSFVKKAPPAPVDLKPSATVAAAPGPNEAAAAPDQPQPEQPQKVEIVSPSSGPVLFLQSALAGLVKHTATALGVLLLVVFILIEREELRDRLIRLSGKGRLNLTTQAMDDAAKRVSRYLLMQMIVNLAYGIIVAICLYFIGVPNAILWGSLSTLLRFIPYIGPWIAAFMPLMLSLAVFDSWTQPVLTVGTYVTLELITANVIEPMLYGSSTGLSLVAMLVAAAFWTWLWGAVGLIVSIPVTVCLVVLGENVPQLQFLEILLTDRHVLDPDVRFYQRLLAMDLGEAGKLVRTALTTQPIALVYDTIMIPALCMAENDSQRGEIDSDRLQLIHENMKELIDDLGEHDKKIRAEADADHSSDSASTPADRINKEIITLCLPAKTAADEIAGVMLTQLLCKHGFNAKSVSMKVLASEMLDQITEEKAAIVCISALPPMTDMHARYLNKRIKARFPEIRSVICVWDRRSNALTVQERLGIAGSENVVVSMTDAISFVEAMAQSVLPPALAPVVAASAGHVASPAAA